MTPSIPPRPLTVLPEGRAVRCLRPAELDLTTAPVGLDRPVSAGVEPV